MIYCFGSMVQSGTYILVIDVRADISIRIGKSNKRQNIEFPEGTYIYIGSAMGKKGASSLGNRLIRHVSRSNGIDHKIKPLLIKYFNKEGINHTNNSKKTLFWNIDYLLEKINVEVTNIICKRSDIPLEKMWSEYLECYPNTFIISRGFGANDHKGHTHLIGINNLNIKNLIDDINNLNS